MTAVAAACGSPPTAPPGSDGAGRPTSDPTAAATSEEPAHGEPTGEPGALAWSRANVDAAPGEPLGAAIVVRDGRTTVVADDAAYRSAPTWSPDGDVLAYLADGALVVATVGGRTDTVVRCTPPSCLGLGPPAWSPSGDALAFGYVGADREGLALVDPEGSRPSIVAELVFDGAPAWSPDGRAIAVPAGSSIEIVDAGDGGTVRTLRFPGRLGDRIAWSPDGATFAVDGRADGVAGVFVLPADGAGEPSLLTRCDDPGCTDLDPAWSPDGRSVVFTRARCDVAGGDCFTGDLFVVAVDGGSARPLVRSPAPECCAAWQAVPTG